MNTLDSQKLPKHFKGYKSHESVVLVRSVREQEKTPHTDHLCLTWIPEATLLLNPASQRSAKRA